MAANTLGARFVIYLSSAVVLILTVSRAAKIFDFVVQCIPVNVVNHGRYVAVEVQENSLVQVQGTTSNLRRQIPSALPYAPPRVGFTTALNAAQTTFWLVLKQLANFGLRDQDFLYLYVSKPLAASGKPTFQGELVASSCDSRFAV